MNRKEDWIYSLYVQHIQAQSKNKNTTMKVKIKKLYSVAVIPSYAKSGDAGMDLTALRQISNTTFQAIYGTGIAVEIPDGYVGLIFPRSSVRKTDLMLSNSVGVIDSGYRGEIQLTFNKLNGMDSLQYQVGDRIGQLMIIPYPQIEFEEVEELSSTERGEGGYGSTGN
jgi:dUTP pyrophosphatase